MPNRTYAKEWLEFAMRNLKTARLLYEADHYEDIIGIELQQALEKALKSIMANENIKIPKDHDLVKIYFIVEQFINISDDEIVLLKKATNYYKEDRYPNPNYCLPSRDEIKEILNFTEELFDKVCDILDIDKNEVKR